MAGIMTAHHQTDVAHFAATAIGASQQPMRRILVFNDQRPPWLFRTIGVGCV